MVGWQEGHLSCKKPVPVILRGSVYKQVEEEYLRGNWLTEVVTL